MTKTIKERSEAWLKSGKTGASSKTINAYLSGKELSDIDISYPHDAGDFGRCLGLLTEVPEWEERIGELSNLPGYKGEIWGQLADIWGELEDAYHEEKARCTNMIKFIIEPLEKKSGRVVQVTDKAKITLPPFMAAPKKADKRPAAKDHNSQPDVAGISCQRLRSFIERIEKLEEEKAAVAEDIKEVYSEAKGTGFDVKTMRKIIRLRKMDDEKRREEDELLNLYRTALGIEPFATTPLGGHSQ